jgi:hypothetical protein
MTTKEALKRMRFNARDKKRLLKSWNFKKKELV